MSEQQTDKHVDTVIAKHKARVAKGIAKYGCTLATNPADLRERLQHIQEEAMDAAAYCEWAMAAIEQPAAAVEAERERCARIAEDAAREAEKLADDIEEMDEADQMRVAARMARNIASAIRSKEAD